MSVWETLDRHTDATKVAQCSAEALEKAGVPPPQQAERSITEQRALAWEMFFATGSDASDDDSTQYRIAGDPITPGAALDAVAASQRAAGPLAATSERAAPAQLLSVWPVRRGVQW